MLGRWAAIAARLTAGKQVSDSPVRDEQPPFDTGESMDLGPALADHHRRASGRA